MHLEKPYNSIQDGNCCRKCWAKEVIKARLDGTLIAVSERYRIDIDQVGLRVADHVEGLPRDPFTGEEYIDRAIIHVTDGTDPAFPGVRELIIINASLTKEECFCANDGT